MSMVMSSMLIMAFLQLKKTKGRHYSGFLADLTKNEIKAAIIALILFVIGFGIMFFAAAFVF